LSSSDWSSDVCSSDLHTGGCAFKLGYGNYGGAELAAEMQAKLWAVDATAQVTYASKTGRIQIVMSAGNQI